MKKVLLAVDNTKGSEQAAKTVAKWANEFQPDTIILLHVQKFFGQSIIGEGLESDQDIQEVNVALKGSELMDKLNAESDRILSHYTNILREAGHKTIQALVKQGHPAEQIVETASQEGVDLIVLGSRGGRAHSLLVGSVSREVANTAKVSVLIAH